MTDITKGEFVYTFVWLFATVSSYKTGVETELNRYPDPTFLVGIGLYHG